MLVSGMGMASETLAAPVQVRRGGMIGAGIGPAACPPV
jgi:hypothetical protein